MIRIGLVLLLIEILFYSNVYGGVEYRGNLIERLNYYHLKKDTLLNPNLKFSSLPKWENSLYANLCLNIGYKEWLKMVIKNRPLWVVSDEDKDSCKNLVDDVYLDIRLQDALFLTIGKQNLQEGVGLSYNPSDFLAQDKEMDYSKREEERKGDRKGDYLIRLEKITESLTLSLLLAPKIDNLQKEDARYLIKAYSLMGDVDVSLSYFHAVHPKLGINISGVIGNNVEIHMEAGLSKGSNRKFLRKKKEVGPSNLGVYEYETYDAEDDDKIFTKVLLGGHYTFANKTNIIIEYFFNQDGYSVSEWDEFIALVEDSFNKFKRPPVGFSYELFAENLRLANSCMRFRYLRKDYLFFRISNPEFFDYYDSQLSLLLNVNDGSMVVMSSIDYRGFKNLVVRFGLNWFLGDSKSEFGLVPYNTEFQLGARYFF